MKKPIKLKPCPFCGGNAEYAYYPATNFELVGCGKCEIQMEANHGGGWAVKKWNRRAKVKK